jgi:spore maturation protein CgeD
MKVSCILTSYNRPRLVQQALASVAEQTHRDFELIVVDESTVFDIAKVMPSFSFPEVHLLRQKVDPQERARQNRLSININAGLRVTKGDLLCFLADDDFYYPGWFAAAVQFFSGHPGIHAGFGKLRYTSSQERVYPKNGEVRFFDGPVADPYCRLDHNQIIHRRITPPILWPEEIVHLTGPDGIYARGVAKHWPFHPIDSFAAVKRMHSKNLQQNADKYRAGKLEDLRE